MDKKLKYTRLESVTFILSANDVFNLLKSADEIPAGFVPDYELAEQMEWPIELTVTRETPDSATGDE